MARYRISTWLYFALICYVPIAGIFLPETHFGAGIPDIDVVRFCSYLLVLIFFIESAIQQKVKLMHKWIFITLCYTVIVCVSPIWSKWYTYNHTTVQELFNSVFLPFLVMLIAVNIFMQPATIHRYMKNVLLAATILSLISIYQAVFKLTEINGQIRAAATLNNPNLLAVYLVICIPTLLYCIDKRIISKKTGWLTQLIIIGGILGTVSRKGMITLVISYYLYFILKKQYKKIIFATLAFMVLGALAFGYSTISGRFTGEALEKVVYGKWDMAVAGLKMFIDKPLLGLGYKGYFENFGNYFTHAWVKKYDAHNEYITALTNYGILGFVLFTAIFLYPLNYARKVLKRSRFMDSVSETQKDMAVICICSVIPFMLNALYAGTLFYQQVAVFIFYTHASFVFVKNIQAKTS